MFVAVCMNLDLEIESRHKAYIESWIPLLNLTSIHLFHYHIL